MDTNVIYCGDNLEVLPKYIPDESVDLIYIDPPFNTSRQYEVFWGEARERRAFNDRYGDAMSYLDWMRGRIHQLYRVLKPSGSFYYHCDPHASHYVKVELDQVFGANNFRNEIVWKRTNVHSDSRRWSDVSDRILYYVKNARAGITWNPPWAAHSTEYLASKYRNVDPDGRRYELDNMTSPNPRPNMMYEWKGHPSPPNGWRYSKETMARLDAEGRIWYPKDTTKRPRFKRYLDEQQGQLMTDVWTDIDPLNSQAKERLGYPTQKPLSLLERIIGASSNEGHVVLDAFCGCGTTLEAAAKLKRRWIGIDSSPTACRVMADRLEDRLGLREGVDFRVADMPKSEADLRRMPHFEFQNWAVIALGGIPNRVKSGDYGIDGRLYAAGVAKPKAAGRDLFGEMDNWYPIQVKQVDRAGRPDIDQFQTTMRRDRRLKGYFVAFGYSKDAMREILRANHNDGLDIVPVTVAELLKDERIAG
jgi:DNA modification methylase